MRRSITTMLVAAGSAMVGWAAAQLLRNRRKQQRDWTEKRDLVDEAGLESFPASDPPSWTLGEDQR